MLIVALVLAVIGLIALVTAVVTSSEIVAWVCIAASVLGVILLIVDAIRERQRGTAADVADAEEPVVPPDDSTEATYQNFDADYPEETPATAPSDVDTTEEPRSNQP
ncbi:phage holin family protein [Mycobacterium sp. ACS4331]|uniref:phage holin family protein n=1 Tax=Mycobacterium sp. ACS4331 TaxID=1834121 RepID=UPI000A56946A|nr:phage holin family protein [Mycobacterium sp. ACS4331]